MKKILSLLALLVTTVTAFATDYTDAFSYTILQMSESFESKTLTVTDKGDGTYDVTIKGFNAATIGQNFGDMTFAGMSGTTTGDVTTINATNVTATQTEGTYYTFVATDVTVKFNADKAYFHAAGKISGAYNFEQTFGTDEGFGGDTPVTPVVEYPINFDKDATNKHSARRTTSISLQQEGKDVQTITLNSSLNGYEDHSEGEPFTVDAGSEVTPTFGYNGEWMHGYVYIDLDNNKQFDVNADDLDNSPELVAYSYYKDLNSDGESAAASVNVNPPSFTAPTVPGTYRIRFKIDWDNVDPGGSVVDGNHILNNGGGIWDATLVVEGAAQTATEYTGTWNVTRKGYTTSEKTENAVVSILLKDESTAQVTIPTFSDLDEEYPGTVAPLTFDVNYTEAQDGEVTYVKFVGSNDNLEISEGDWNGYGASVSMDGKLVDGVLTATFNVMLGGMEEYTYELGFNVMPFVAHTETYNDVANVTFGEQTVNFDEASVEVTEYEKDKYSLTYKSLTLNGNEVGDFKISNITVGEDNTLSTTATTGEWTRTVENNAAGVNAGDEAEIRNFEFTSTTNDENTKLVVKFGVNVQGEWADVVFGEKAEILPEPTVYTDKAHTTYWGDFDYTDKVVNVYDLGENKYKVVYKEFNLGSSTTFDLVFDNVEGTTDDEGYTTYTFDGKAITENVHVNQGVIASVSEGGEVDATLEGKSKDGKLYATFTVSPMGDMAKTVYGSEFTTPEEPKADYAINFDKDTTNPHASRRTTSISLQQEGKDVQTISVDASKIYDDHSADEPFTVEAGSEVAATFGYNGEWMHGYVYIDLDDNKQFDVNADDLDNSPELVAYSYYDGLNSDGESVSNNVNVTPPTFTAPATSGTYRIRFKIDWDNVDPGGCVDPSNSIINNGGGIWDATLKVTEPIVDAINSINAEAAQGNAEIFTVNGTKVAKLQKGINLVRTADGKVKKVLVK